MIVLPSQKNCNSMIFDFTACPNIGETVQDGVCKCPSGQSVQKGACVPNTPISAGKSY